MIDRTTSVVPLSKGADTQGNGQGYGLLEQWIARLGCYTVRKEGPEAFSGDALVVICPSRSAMEDFRDELSQYVAGGGKLLVIDSPENAGSTANSLLWPFGLSIHHDRAWKGKLSTSSRLPVVDVTGANQVSGGQPVGKLDQLPVVATAKYGKGSVMVVGCGSLWNDKQMGEHWMLEPDPDGEGPLRRSLRPAAIVPRQQTASGAAGGGENGEGGEEKRRKTGEKTGPWIAAERIRAGDAMKQGGRRKGEFRLPPSQETPNGPFDVRPGRLRLW